MPGLGRGPPGPPGPVGRNAGRGGMAVPLAAIGAPAGFGGPAGPAGRAIGGRVLGELPPTPNGLLPTRGPGRAGAGRIADPPSATAAGSGVSSTSTGAGARTAAGASGSGAAGATGAWTGAGSMSGRAITSTADAFAAGAFAAAFFAGAFLAGAATAGNASCKRRTTGASTVDDGPLTYSPNSASLVTTSLLDIPSSFASSCTRALPATGLLNGGPGGNPLGLDQTVICLSLEVLHRVPIALCSLSVRRAGSRSSGQQFHYRGRVDRSRHAQRPAVRPASLCQLGALQIGVQPRASTRCASIGIRYDENQVGSRRCHRHHDA
jgi:hypothetical protein